MTTLRRIGRPVLFFLVQLFSSDEKKICTILSEKVGKICPDAEIMTFASGEELLGADRLPDILLLDIKMPGMSGMEVAKILRDRDWRKILIFITGEEDQVFNSLNVFTPNGAWIHYRRLHSKIGKGCSIFPETLLYFSEKGALFKRNTQNREMKDGGY